ncbi:hypothetical protein PZ61_0231715 [Streptomyces sp. MNU77]|uniref:AAA family ATPase n=1 Tax=Streptomyces sp. MNU77 TaxID=1573406 RepID=UPI0005E21E7B|nr:AAA family ATPase [Streptomyces sp. MNU77]OLO34624.1 hypothetical protein PZ61_0231715 [Streptomyces sp. MNU77]
MTENSCFVTIGVGEYDDDGWPTLRHVPGSVRKVRELLLSLGYDDVLTGLTQEDTWQGITGQLKAWQGSGSLLVLYWTGHGCVDADQHFLLAADSPASRLDDFNAVSTTGLARLLVHQSFREVLILLDCCASGVAASRMVSEISKVMDHTSSVGPARRFAVIASACGYESAEDGVFAEAFEHAVRRGPDDRRWTEHDETIRSDELADVVSQMLAERDGRTAYLARGAPVPVLRNPLHPTAAIPDEDVETKQLRRLRANSVDQHLVLSARGIEVGETGWYFSGRHRLMRRVIDWLTGGKHGLFAVTGSPGTGKSALLGRIATLSVPSLRAVAEEEGALNHTPNSALPPLGSVDLALSCRNKTLDDCLRAVADALQISVPTDGWLQAPHVVERIGALGRPVTVVFDGLDEAQPAEAVSIAADLLRPLADLPGVRVLVGTRPRRAGGDAMPHTTWGGPLLGALAPDELAVLDDEPESAADLKAYALRRLTGDGSPLKGQVGLAQVWADRIGGASNGIFLFARIAARAVSGELEAGGSPEGRLGELLSGGLTEVLDREFGRSADPGRLRDLLRPLAWAEGAGIPRRDVWPVLATALADDGRAYRDEDVSWVLQEAGFHLVESGESGQTVYRLYHQALIDHFRDQSPPDAQQCITRALRAMVPGGTTEAWESVSPYLHRHAAAHALAAHMLPEMMLSLGFLTCVDPARAEAAVRALPGRFTLPLARLYLRAAPALRQLTPVERLRTLQMTALVEEPSLLGWLQRHSEVPALLTGASTVPDDFSVVLRGHSGPVTALHVVQDAYGKELLASASGDTTVRLWDPHAGETRMVFSGVDATVTAVTSLVDARGRRLLAAAAGRDIHVWDLADGSSVTVLSAHSDVVLCLAAVDGPAPLLVSAGKDRVLRLWNTEDWSHSVTRGHLGSVAALAIGRLPDGGRFLLSAGADCVLRRWTLPSSLSPGGGVTLGGVMYGHTGPVHALAVAEMPGGRYLAVSGGDDGTVRVWDPERLSTYRVVPGMVRDVRALAPFDLGERTLVAVAGKGSRIAVVDPVGGEVLRLFNSRAFTSADPEAAESGTGGQIDLFRRSHVFPDRLETHSGSGSYALASLGSGGGTPMFASAGWGGAVHLWDTNSGGPPDQPEFDRHRARLISALPHPAQELPWTLAVAGGEGGAWLTDAQGRRHAPLLPRHHTVTELATLLLPEGKSVVALAEEKSSKVRLIDASTQEEVTVLSPEHEDHLVDGSVTSIRAFTAPGRIAVLVVCYEQLAPQTFVWHRPHGCTRVERSLEPGQCVAEVPFGHGDDQWLSAVVDARGTVEVWGDPRDEEGFRIVGTTRGTVVEDVPPVALRMPRGAAALAVLTHAPNPIQDLSASFRRAPYHVLKLWDLRATPADLRCVTLHHTGEAVLCWASLEHDDQDLLVAACADNHLRVWNPDRLGREPVAVPLPGLATGITSVGPDTVYVLVDEHWLAFRLLGLGPLLAR